MPLKQVIKALEYVADKKGLKGPRRAMFIKAMMQMMKRFPSGNKPMGPPRAMGPRAGGRPMMRR